MRSSKWMQISGVYSRSNLLVVPMCLAQTKDGTYILNLDEYNSIGTHWLALYVNGDNVTYCDSFGVEYIPKEMKKFIGNKNITTKIFIEHKPITQ